VKSKELTNKNRTRSLSINLEYFGYSEIRNLVGILTRKRLQNYEGAVKSIMGLTRVITTYSIELIDYVPVKVHVVRYSVESCPVI